MPIQMVSKALSPGQVAEQGRCGRVLWPGGTTETSRGGVAGDLGGSLSVTCLP